MSLNEYIFTCETLVCYLITIIRNVQNRRYSTHYFNTHKHNSNIIQLFKSKLINNIRYVFIDNCI